MRAVFCVLIAALATGCSKAPETPAKEALPAAAGPKITMFYANPPVIAKGEKGQLCYGVEGAESVTLEPPVERVWPAVSRCFDVEPAEAVTYKLIAKGSGKEVSQEVKVGTGPAAVKLITVTVSSLAIRRGEQLQICWEAKNAAGVEIPGVSIQGQSPNKGCVVQSPQRTTTYTVRVKGSGGDVDVESVTVKVS
jgi:hypothetical protein